MLIMKYFYQGIGFTQIIFNIKKENIDILSGNNFSNDSFIYLLAAKFIRVPFIWHIREMISSNNTLATKRLKMANKLIAVSDACKKK